jgi:hypothetical protein
MSAAVATAAVSTAEASHVSAAKAARMAIAKRLVMPFAIVMVLPIMVVPEIRPVASSIERKSIRVGGVAIAWMAIVAISRFATSARHAGE